MVALTVLLLALWQLLAPVELLRVVVSEPAGGFAVWEGQCHSRTPAVGVVFGACIGAYMFALVAAACGLSYALRGFHSKFSEHKALFFVSYNALASGVVYTALELLFVGLRQWARLLIVAVLVAWNVHILLLAFFAPRLRYLVLYGDVENLLEFVKERPEFAAKARPRSRFARARARARHLCLTRGAPPGRPFCSRGPAHVSSDVFLEARHGESARGALGPIRRDRAQVAHRAREARRRRAPSPFRAVREGDPRARPRRPRRVRGRRAKQGLVNARGPVEQRVRSRLAARRAAARKRQDALEHVKPPRGAFPGGSAQGCSSRPSCFSCSTTNLQLPRRFEAG